MVAVAGDFLSLFRRWKTWILMANQDIALRYKRSVIGPFWISIAMAITVFGIGLLYSEVQGLKVDSFLSWLGCGILGWSLLSAMILDGCHLLGENESTLRNVPLPVPSLAARSVYRNVIVFLHNALAVGLLLLYIGTPWTPVVLMAPLALLVYIPFGWFVAIAFGPICARFRDLTQVIASALQLLFFLTPIFWVPSSAMSRPEIYMANPLYHMLQLLRAPLLGEAPTPLNIQVSLITVAATGLLAVISLSYSRKRIFLWL